MYKISLKQLGFTNLRYGCASNPSSESGRGRLGLKALQTLSDLTLVSHTYFNQQEN